MFLDSFQKSYQSSLMAMTAKNSAFWRSLKPLIFHGFFSSRAQKGIDILQICRTFGPKACL